MIVYDLKDMLSTSVDLAEDYHSVNIVCTNTDRDYLTLDSVTSDKDSVNIQITENTAEWLYKYDGKITYYEDTFEEWMECSSCGFDPWTEFDIDFYGYEHLEELTEKWRFCPNCGRKIEFKRRDDI